MIRKYDAASQTRSAQCENGSAIKLHVGEGPYIEPCTSAEREPPCAVCSTWLLEIFESIGQLEDWLTARRPRAPFKKDDDLAKNDWRPAPSREMQAFSALSHRSVDIPPACCAPAPEARVPAAEPLTRLTAHSHYTGKAQSPTAAGIYNEQPRTFAPFAAPPSASIMDPSAASAQPSVRGAAESAQNPGMLEVYSMAPNTTAVQQNITMVQPHVQVYTSLSMPTTMAQATAPPQTPMHQPLRPVTALSLNIPPTQQFQQHQPRFDEATDIPPTQQQQQQFQQHRPRFEEAVDHASQLPGSPVLHSSLPSCVDTLNMSPRNIREIRFQELDLGRIIGEGGFARVHHACWRGLAVAVKVMSTDISKRGDVVHEFRREVETMSCMQPHRHVLQLLGACTQGEPLALVTEYCARGSLYGMLHSAHVHLSWRQIYYMCLGAANGMCHLHSQNIIHRDLKSGNLLVDEHLCVKVADFGLSKVTKDFQTLTGGLGTYQWMAPEVLANSRYSEKADVYSFGIVLWECAARQVPYAGTLGMPAAIAVMNRGLRPEIPKYTPPALAELMRRCWAALPKDRPSFDVVAEELSVMYKQAAQS